MERMENDRIAKKVYVGECAGSHSVDSRGRGGLKDCLKKRGLDVRQARRVVHNMGFMRGNAWGIAWGMNP